MTYLQGEYMFNNCYSIIAIIIPDLKLNLKSIYPILRIHTLESAAKCQLYSRNL